MSELDAETLDRIEKLEIDSGVARTVEEAHEIAAGRVLQIEVGESLTADQELALLTVINTAHRAFKGGVRVRIARDLVMTTAWASGKRLGDVVPEFGGKIVEQTLSDDYPTVAIGCDLESVDGSVTIAPTWQGWAGGAVPRGGDRLPEAGGFAPAIVLASALCVSEAFQHARGSRLAGRRSVGLSLWSLDADWRSAEAVGDMDDWVLPQSLWLAGLGHLGQAYAWLIGALPFRDMRDVEVIVQDFDIAKDANRATSLLTFDGDVGELKTRTVARRLERLGARVRIVERKFDAATAPVGDEPRILLVGFDKPGARRAMAVEGFRLIVDGGLGGGTEGYLDIRIHTFPASASPVEAFHEVTREIDEADLPAYRDLIDRQIGAGASAAEAKCGILELAGQTVGTAFVGTVAASIVLAEVIKTLTQPELRDEVVDLSLRNPYGTYVRCSAVPADSAGIINPGYLEHR